MSGFYVLDDLGRPMAVEDGLVWAAFFEHSAGRIVAQDVVDNRLFVSTVFLGLNHRFGDDGPPILWETMTFYHDGWQPGAAGANFDDECSMKRYSSREDAERGHQMAINVATRWLQEYDARKESER